MAQLLVKQLPDMQLPMLVDYLQSRTLITEKQFRAVKLNMIFESGTG